MFGSVLVLLVRSCLSSADERDHPPRILVFADFLSGTPVDGQTLSIRHLADALGSASS